MNVDKKTLSTLLLSFFIFLLLFSPSAVLANGNVHVTRFWHNHQPIYWPEWNGNGSQTERVQYAWDSIVLKNGQTYNSGEAHPDNNLTDIFGKDDRKAAYQGRPRDSLSGLSGQAGFAMSYSGSLIENVNSLGQAGQLGYGGNWWDGNRQAKSWTTPGGSPRLDLLGFTYHHSLGAVLPKPVLRKEIQIFKQVWWKAWNGNSDLSDHSKGFFPTEMAFSTPMVDVLVDEGYDWVIVASHHLSRTCPTYNDHANPPSSFNIKSSPPNKADQIGPSPTSGWWFNEPNPGQATWNVAPFAYQLHKVKYINPNTGAQKDIIAVPSDDTLSYVAGYSGAQVGMISGNISPFANDPNKPVLVMPSTDGDNAWGGGSSSWLESTPSFFGSCEGAGYNTTTPQDFVNAYGGNADYAHVENGAWIFPESAYGAPYFFKWVEPPLDPDSPTVYPGTLVDCETPGFALKFWSWAPVIAGANWCETAEQIMLGEGGSVDAWKIQAPYDWNGTHNSPNVVERAWHIYLAGLDSGFNYYGGLGNDDEVKQSLATRRAVEILQSYVNARLASDATPPTIFYPQRFPWNPGAYTFGWFNSVPGGDTSYLKEMPSEFYIWTHVYDVSDVSSVNLKIRIDNDGANPLTSHQNETYAGGGEVGSWINVPMTKRVLPNDSASLNAAANHGDIDYFSDALSPEIADYYFAKITDLNVPAFRGKLLDYYIEATDTKGNVQKTDIEHVWVEDDGGGTGGPSLLISGTETYPGPTHNVCPDGDCNPTLQPEEELQVDAFTTPVQSGVGVTIHYRVDSGAWSTVAAAWDSDNGSISKWNANLGSNTVGSCIDYWISASNSTTNVVNDNSGAYYTICVEQEAVMSTATFSPAAPNGCVPVTITYAPNDGPLTGATEVKIHVGHSNWQDVVLPNPSMTDNMDGTWSYTYQIPAGATVVNCVFNDGTVWDNNNFNNWSAPVVNCAGAFTLDLCAAADTPVITIDPANSAHQNNIGDNFDLDESGGSASMVDQGGFGSFGEVYINHDANYLYLGAKGVDTSGDNNSMVVFLGVDTLSYDAQTLWSMSGGPLGLDDLHNFQCPSTPLDIAILLGDENGDENDPSAQTGNGYAFGQGVYTLQSSGFAAITGARLSQFDGTGTTATTSDDNDGNTTTERWEARIPWADLGATQMEDINVMHIAGFILSDATTSPDRYLSGNYLGQNASSVNGPDQYNNFGMDFVTLQALEVCLHHLDNDNDGFDNGQESLLGTNPMDPTSGLFLDSVVIAGPMPTVQWQSVGGKEYTVEYSDSLTQSNNWQYMGQKQETNVPVGVESTEEIDDLSPQPTNGFRCYRVRLDI